MKASEHRRDGATIASVVYFQPQEKEVFRATRLCIMMRVCAAIESDFEGAQSAHKAPPEDVGSLDSQSGFVDPWRTAVASRHSSSSSSRRRAEFKRGSMQPVQNELRLLLLLLPAPLRLLLPPRPADLNRYSRHPQSWNRNCPGLIGKMVHSAACQRPAQAKHQGPARAMHSAVAATVRSRRRCHAAEEQPVATLPRR